MADNTLSQTSKKNRKKLKTLKRHVNQLCNDVLTPLCNADKEIQLSSDFVDDIESFAGYARFLHLSPIIVTRKSSALIVLASELEYRSSETWHGRVTGADDDRDNLTMLSEGIKNAVDAFVVSHHFTTCIIFTLIPPI